MTLPTVLRPNSGALVVLSALAVLCPALFWAGLPEVFEAPKSLLLHAGGILLALLGVIALSAPGRKALPRDPVTLTILAGVAVATLATMASFAPLISSVGVLESHWGLLTPASLAVVYLATRCSVRTRNHALMLVAALAVGTSLAAGYGLAQAARLDPLRWEGVSEFAGWVRPGGTEGHAIKLGALLVAVLPLAVWLGSVRSRGMAVLLSLLWIGVLVSLLARGAWLGTAVAACLGLALGKRPAWLTWTRIGLVIGAILGLAALTGLAGPLFSRILGIGDSSSRLYIYRAAWDLFLERPALGWGPETFQLVFGRHRAPEYWELEWGRTPLRAHNEFLHVLATQGSVGGLAYLVLLAAIARAGWVGWHRTPADRGLTLALLASAAAYQTQLITGFSTITGGVAFAITCGLLARLAEGPLLEPAPHPGGQFLLLALAVAGSGILASNVIVFSIHPPGIAAWGIVLSIAVLAIGTALAFRPLSVTVTEENPAPNVPGSILICAAVGTALALWMTVVRPGVGWALCGGSPESANLHHLHEAVRWAPERAEVWLRLGACAQRDALRQPDEAARGRFLEKALWSAEQCCLLCPNDPEAHNQRARGLMELARAGRRSLDDTLSAYEDALRLDARNVLLLRDAARAALAFQKPARAEPYLRRAIEAGPAHGSVLAEMAAARWMMGDPVGARGVIQESIQAPWYDDVDGLNRARGLMALIALDTRDELHALQLARTIETDRPLWPAGYLIEGRTLEKLGRPTEAKAAYERALELEPGNANAINGLRRLRSHR